MNTKYFKVIFAVMTAVLIAVTSCINDLNTIPKDPKVVTSATVYKDAAAYKQVLAKCYAGLAVSGQQGPHGSPDISGIDEGFSQYLRQYWLAQELTTDEAVIAWNDGTLKDYHYQTWTSGGEFIKAMYNRLYYQISLCNEFIRESSDAKIDERGITGADKSAVQTYRAEARFLRALSYYHALDLFGNVPFVDENNSVGAFLPEQITRAKLFEYLESELLALEPTLVAAKANEYGRADKAAAWMLLSKLYLNAKVYIGAEKYTECLTWVKKVIASPYTLETNYSHLFLADNNTCDEIIFPITFDGIHTKTWGGTTFIVHAGVGGSMSPAAFGIDGGWGGTRVTPQFVDKFADITGATDKRAMFYTSGQSKSISDIFNFPDGYAITKWKNVTSAGAAGSNLTHPDTDFPVFRLADAYLMYAEAVLRGGSGGDAATALNYVNLLRQRAYGDASGNINTGQLTLDFIIDERSRELYGECHRRTDLIRFGKFSNSTYVWEWKGGVKAGATTDSHLDLFPIPASDMGANPNLTQNTGY
ncbi:MAG: RagB/SusD family nutrient uptake outer membrane protein [Bacteroidales bacterium]